MTYEQALENSQFRLDYQDNCDEREAWGDPVLTREEYFEIWDRRNEPCESLK